jgi:hypothetical protein
VALHGFGTVFDVGAITYRIMGSAWVTDTSSVRIAATAAELAALTVDDRQCPM